MAWHAEIVNERNSTGGMPLELSRKHSLSVSTSRKRADELWSLLRYSTLLDKSVDSNLRIKGAKTKKQKDFVKSELSSHIDQAENFYNNACNSDYRSAALLYYYSFLNLAKVLLIKNNPNLAGKTFRHGINPCNKSGELVGRSFKVRESSAKNIQVFGELYKNEYGKEFPRKSPISFKNTLGYITDVTLEVSKLIPVSTRKTYPTHAHIVVNGDTNKCWTVLATPIFFYPNSYKKTFANFEENYERFDPSILTLNSRYKMSKLDARLYSFSQSKSEIDLGQGGSIPVDKCKDEVRKALGDFYQDNMFDTPEPFSITAPLRTNMQVPFNETLAIYSTMFYLSEVVRYTPGEFNRNLAISTTEGWVIKSFIESCPYTCLLNLVSMITDTNYTLNNR